jgi:hypothetical protein
MSGMAQLTGRLETHTDVTRPWAAGARAEPLGVAAAAPFPSRPSRISGLVPGGSAPPTHSPGAAEADDRRAGAPAPRDTGTGALRPVVLGRLAASGERAQLVDPQRAQQYSERGVDEASREQ